MKACGIVVSNDADDGLEGWLLVAVRCDAISEDDTYIHCWLDEFSGAYAHAHVSATAPGQVCLVDVEDLHPCK